MTAQVRVAIVAIAIALSAIGGAQPASASISSTHIDGEMRLSSAQAPCIGAGASDVEAASTQEQTVHHAGLVVVFPDGAQSWCIEFTGDDISGTDLLRESGLSVVFAGFGGLGSGVCRIEDVGCSDPGDCFCQCRGADCRYWNYFTLRDGGWSYLALGPSQHQLHDGDVDGWVWGAGRTAPGDSRGPCPVVPEPTPVPTPTSAPVVLTAVAPLGGRSGSNQIETRSAPVASAAAVQAATGTAVATRTPPSQVAGRADVGNANRASSSTSKSGGGGTPVGLIAFGAVASVLVLGIGGVALRRRIGG